MNVALAVSIRPVRVPAPEDFVPPTLGSNLRQTSPHTTRECLRQYHKGHNRFFPRVLPVLAPSSSAQYSLREIREVHLPTGIISAPDRRVRRIPIPLP